MLYNIFPGKKNHHLIHFLLLGNTSSLAQQDTGLYGFPSPQWCLIHSLFFDPCNSPQFCSIGGTTRAKSNASCPSTFSLFMISFSSLVLYAIEVKWSESHSVVSDSLQPRDCCQPGSSVHGILQARILEWVVVPFSRDSSQARIEPRSPALQADSLPSEPPGKPRILKWVIYPFSSGFSWPKNWIGISCIAEGFFTSCAMLTPRNSAVAQSFLPNCKLMHWVMS